MVASTSTSNLINPKRWYAALNDCQQNGIPHVLVTIVKVSGSAPRDLQAKMVITETHQFDSIGGGGLEFDVVHTAQALIKNKPNSIKNSEDINKTSLESINNSHKSVMTKHYPLGAKLGQCCGGSVTVLFECFYLTPPLSLFIFGAGHVATALMGVLSQLNCQVDWIDNRPNIFKSIVNTNITSEKFMQEANRGLSLPAHIRTHVSEDPTEFIKPYQTPRYILVMTHDHSLDFDIVKTALEVNLQHKNNIKHFPYIGCIASKTKASRFNQRIQQRGFNDTDLESLYMPIGLPIGGKVPMAVAISVMAQVLQHFNQP